jgi:hypothetical protein
VWNPLRWRLLNIITAHRNVTLEVIELAAKFACDDSHKHVFDSLNYRPVMSKFDAAVCVAKCIGATKTKPDCQDRVIVWDKSSKTEPYHSKIGGIPFLAENESWPRNELGEPLLFIGQIFIEDGFLSNAINLPGNVLRIFAPPHTGTKSFKGVVFSLVASMLTFTWGQAGAATESQFALLRPLGPTLPFEYGGAIVHFEGGSPFSSTGWFCTRICEGYFRSGATRYSRSLKERFFRRQTPFVQIASLDVGYERSNLFLTGDEGRPNKQWPAFETGPVLFGDLGSIVLFSESTDFSIVDID